MFSVRVLSYAHVEQGIELQALHIAGKGSTMELRLGPQWRLFEIRKFKQCRPLNARPGLYPFSL